jgi:hypothetical protein
MPTHVSWHCLLKQQQRCWEVEAMLAALPSLSSDGMYSKAVGYHTLASFAQ